MPTTGTGVMYTVVRHWSDGWYGVGFRVSTGTHRAQTTTRRGRTRVTGGVANEQGSRTGLFLLLPEIVILPQETPTRSYLTRHCSRQRATTVRTANSMTYAPRRTTFPRERGTGPHATRRGHLSTGPGLTRMLCPIAQCPPNALPAAAQVAPRGAPSRTPGTLRSTLPRDPPNAHTPRAAMRTHARGTSGPSLVCAARCTAACTASSVLA